MEVGRQDYSQAGATEWYNLSFSMLVSLAWLPVLSASVILIGLAWWWSGSQSIDGLYYSIALLIVYLVVFVGYSIVLLRRVNFTRSHMAVIMGFAGLFTGLFVAIGKIIILFRGWALLRLISEPILTAVLAAIIGVLVFWRRAQLKTY